MERYFEGQKKSVYDFIRNRNFGKYDNIIPEKLLEIQNHSEEQLELKKLIKKLQKKVIEEQDITEITKQLEYFLPLGNNNKLMSFLVFNSKNFIEIIECVNYAKPKHIQNLLHFIEKMIKTNPNIAKYISNNKSFLKKILKLMQDKVSEFIIVIVIIFTFNK